MGDVENGRCYACVETKGIWKISITFSFNFAVNLITLKNKVLKKKKCGERVIQQKISKYKLSVMAQKDAQSKLCLRDCVPTKS